MKKRHFTGRKREFMDDQWVHSCLSHHCIESWCSDGKEEKAALNFQNFSVLSPGKQAATELYRPKRTHLWDDSQMTSHQNIPMGTNCKWCHTAQLDLGLEKDRSFKMHGEGMAN